ncbi:flagellum-specific peptidoglycan hydrolase FlgJ [Chitinophaga skermanii]|uniref:Peptidoglycan hydrolase n=1 Tax=Chitinophaga skermanii TaxID=331697 RepID=A0A327Q655_9BACT|nr:glucosaminidase domain-containing protein [Chitinophaga skermanii]RAI99909.1 flagellum-specific peptidoglycan hydrolase FlgJ [Chitinophaga skermanii]
MRKCCWMLILLVVLGTTARAQNITPTQYINAYRAIAIQEMQRSGVPAAIKLAQGIVETQAGNSVLVLKSNNHFGIKCKNNWTGPSVSYDDDEKGECFRVYESASESYKDHSDFLRKNPRYAFLFNYDPKDYKSWAYGLKQAGYATSNTYTQQLLNTIEKYQLQLITLEGLGEGDTWSDWAANSGSNVNPISTAKNNTPAIPNNNNNSSASNPTKKPNYPTSGTFSINGRKAVYVAKGTSLIQVANDQDIRLSHLVKYNDLKGDLPVEKDMVLFLQRKNKTGKSDTHVVKPGETMHDIAQAEGIQLRWLLKRNKMRGEEEAAAGEKLVLTGYARNMPKLVAKNTKYTEDKDDDGFIDDISTANVINNSKDKEVAKNTGGTKSIPKPSTPPSEPAQEEKESTTPANPTPRNPQPAEPRNPNPPSNPTSPAPTPVSNGNVKWHLVVEKDTLYNISKRYNCTVAQLQAWNNLSDLGIQIGQQLIVAK